VRFDAPLAIGPHPTESSIVESVEVERRRVTIEFDDGIVLETTLRRNGSWHVFREHERWTKSTAAARVVVEVPGLVAVCFGAADVETFRRPDVRRHPILGGAGPDVREADVDLDSVIDRIVAALRGDLTVVEALGDQHLVTGLGNVVRSEALWCARLDPRTPSSELDDEDWRELVEVARSLSTDAPDRLEVYGRLGQICRRCHGAIGCDETEDGRLVYWCASCQTTLDDPRPKIVVDERPTDVRYLDEARAARRRVKIFDDLRDFG
jgi:endonuclease-8